MWVDKKSKLTMTLMAELSVADTSLKDTCTDVKAPQIPQLVIAIPDCRLFIGNCLLNQLVIIYISIGIGFVNPEV